MKIQIVVLMLLLSASCFARIGETEPQCVQRYGEIIKSDIWGNVRENMPSGSWITCNKNGVLTTCTFDRQDEKASKTGVSSDVKILGDNLGQKKEDSNPPKSPSSICVKLNFKEKGSADNAQIEASIPDLLKANGGILRWEEVEKGARWECVNKKFVATFDKKNGLTIWDATAKLFKDQAAVVKAKDNSQDAKAKALKGF